MHALRHKHTITVHVEMGSTQCVHQIAWLQLPPDTNLNCDSSGCLERAPFVRPLQRTRRMLDLVQLLGRLQN